MNNENYSIGYVYKLMQSMEVVNTDDNCKSKPFNSDDSFFEQSFSDSKSIGNLGIPELSEQIQGQVKLDYADELLTFNLPLPNSKHHVLQINSMGFEEFLRQSFPKVHFTKSEIRTVMQFLAEGDLAIIAKKEHVGLETKRSHYKSATAKMGITKQTKMINTLLGGLLMHLSLHELGAASSRNSPFYEYCKRYLPDSVRAIELKDESGTTHRILDMGKISGEPLIVLHPMVLPDLRSEDIEAIDKANLRMLWPLHYGALSSSEDPISRREQLQFCFEGIELIRRFFCTEKIILLPVITSSWFGIRYAELYPERIEKLIFVGACHRFKSYDIPRRQLKKDIAKVISNSEFLLDKLLMFAKGHLSKRERFISMMKRKYTNSKSDAQIIKRDLTENRDRQYYMLSNSLSAIRHDLQNLYDMNWGKLKNTKIPLHFIHGAEDQHTELKVLEELINLVLLDAKLHPLPNCGQLIYHEHFNNFLDKIRDIIKASPN